jgi:hypothetical protein
MGLLQDAAHLGLRQPNAHARKKKRLDGGGRACQEDTTNLILLSMPNKLPN